ncbi:flavohemoglobin expression-modulating QEGLA motif protein [uncultured Ferrimonas sp.]|uniref:flavohemoglobin expression-modulating QEGLA motif protein n=1 Tax=uncultured Ferrimonas sp. TaxID=432640 RepID=UPI002603A9BA|nr:flavohemoglobin expression-modulating QEGLA motif protein [uncultured Ferrimonas sp.]
MPTYSLEQALGLIRKGQTFAGHIEDGRFFLKIDAYLPVVATAIHAGHRLRDELLPNCLLSPEERYFEEDPFTDDMIASQPITLLGCDSRFEYDLNRSMTLSTYYKSAWGKQVWKKPLSRKQREVSQHKHCQFYQLYEALIAKLESLFNHVIVFDIHSYNYQRIERPTPVFNVGTEQIDMERWGAVATRFCSELDLMALPNIEVNAKINDVFAGRGYLITHTNAHFDRTLVLPTEVKKVFMDEQRGEVYPLVVDGLKLGMKHAFSATSAFFERKHNRKRKTRKADMLSGAIEPALLQLDTKLYALARGVDTLTYVNPLNLQSERKRFSASPRRYQPNYRYRQLALDPAAFREQLYRLPLEALDDPGVKQLYGAAVDNLASKIDLISSVGSESFLYNSLRYYGQPSEQDLKNAAFLLHAADLEERDPELLTAAQAKDWLEQQALQWDMPCKIGLSGQMAARAMVVADSPKLLLNRYARFEPSELANLAQHELGVHLATTINARKQPLKLLRLGLPGATFTQEGLAILAEFTSGQMKLSRLKQLAARVIAVDSMVRREGFGPTYERLHHEHRVAAEDAFTITSRVYRGGGFTKDHLYLSGFLAILRLSEQRSLNSLLLGKTSLDYLDLLDELVQRGYLLATQPYVSLKTPDKLSGILSYLVRSMR